jgi:hypothetical protein
MPGKSLDIAQPLFYQIPMGSSAEFCLRNRPVYFIRLLVLLKEYERAP